MKKLFNIFLLVIVSIGLSLSLSVSSAFAIISIVSISSEGIQGNLNTSIYDSSISSDGRYVVFGSNATNLVEGDTNEVQDLFVRDIQTNTTTRISISSEGIEADGDSQAPSISSDGRYIVFDSTATNLVDNDTNEAQDVFLRDIQLNTTTLVSINSDGIQGNSASYEPSISSDGRYIVFDSDATNLVDNDTNNSDDIFVRDTLLNTTTRVSVSTAGIEGNGGYSEASISPDGNFVVYYSNATNLVESDTNNVSDVFVYNILTHTTSRISISTEGA